MSVLESHKRECLERDQQCKHCDQTFSAENLVDHETECDQQTKQCPHCLRKVKMIDMTQHIEGCDCRLVPCPHLCGGKFLNRSLPKHILSCPNRPTAKVHRQVEEAEIDCKYCDDLFKASEIDAHQLQYVWYQVLAII